MLGERPLDQAVDRTVVAQLVLGVAPIEGGTGQLAQLVDQLVRLRVELPAAQELRLGVPLIDGAVSRRKRSRHIGAHRLGEILPTLLVVAGLRQNAVV